MIFVALSVLCFVCHLYTVLMQKRSSYSLILSGLMFSSVCSVGVIVLVGLIFSF